MVAPSPDPAPGAAPLDPGHGTPSGDRHGARHGARGVPTPRAPALVVAAPPGAPGVEELLAGLPAGGVPVLLLEGGLAWLAQPAHLARLRQVASDLALCSQAAREAGVDAAHTPDGVRWSSVATWLAQRDGQPLAWLAP